ncbi:MAG: TrgA family protein [Rhodobacteraceae bacterium]|nr:TrgA family protein [Paracoccaceae bacterium]
MPDAARLFACLSLAVIAFVATGQVLPLLPDGLDPGWFVYINVGIGVAVGWLVMGRRGGLGVMQSVNNGLTGVALTVFWAIVVQASAEMFDRATDNRFDGPLEAIVAVFEIGLGYGQMILIWPIVMTLLIGAVVSGLLTEFAWRNFR